MKKVQMVLVDGVGSFFWALISEREKRQKKKKITRPWRWEQLRTHVLGRIITAVPGKGLLGLHTLAWFWTHLTTPTWKDQVWLMGLNAQSKIPLDIFTHLSSNWYESIYSSPSLVIGFPHNPEPRLHTEHYQVCQKLHPRFKSQKRDTSEQGKKSTINFSDDRQSAP